MAIQRQIRYNVRTETGEQVALRNNWIFLVINHPREIQRISQRILENMPPCDEMEELYQSKIPGERGMHYSLISLLNEKGNLVWYERQKIYKSPNFWYDRNLVIPKHHTSAWISDYVLKLRK